MRFSHEEAGIRAEASRLRPLEAVVKPETRDLPPSRQGKRPAQLWLSPEAHKQLRILAAHLEKSMEQVGVDGLNAVFVENGLPPIA